MEKVDDKPLLHYLIKQLSGSEKISEIIIATTKSKIDDVIVEFAEKNHIEVFRGDEFDVLSRYYNCAKQFQAENIIRITSDNPLIDPKIIDQCISKFEEKEIDFVSNCIKLQNNNWVHSLNGFPSGTTCEIFTFGVLEKIESFAKKKLDREHVTSYMINNSNDFKITNICNSSDYSDFRFTVDYEKDFVVVKKIIEFFNEKDIIFVEDIISFLDANKNLKEINSEYSFNEGYKTSMDKK
mgnify:CR=1 FL=1